MSGASQRRRRHAGQQGLHRASAQVGVQRPQVAQPAGLVGGERLQGEHGAVADHQRGCGRRGGRPGGKRREQGLQPAQVLDRRRAVGDVAGQHPVVERHPAVERHGGRQLHLLAVGPVVAAVAEAHQVRLLVGAAEGDRGEVVGQAGEVEVERAHGGHHQVLPDGVQVRAPARPACAPAGRRCTGAPRAPTGRAAPCPPARSPHAPAAAAPAAG